MAVPQKKPHLAWEWCPSDRMDAGRIRLDLPLQEHGTQDGTLTFQSKPIVMEPHLLRDRATLVRVEIRIVPLSEDEQNGRANELTS